MKIVDVLLPLPFDHPFSYIFDGDESILFRRVLVPFHRRRLTGVVVGEREGISEGLKSVETVLDEFSIFDESFYRFYKELSSYYCVPIGKILKFVLPGWTTYKAVKCVRIRRGADVSGLPEEAVEYLKNFRTTRALRKKFPSIYRKLKKLEEEGIVEVREVFKGKMTPVEIEEMELPPSEIELTDEQKFCIEKVKESLGDFKLFLLFGPPASGKTEIYIELAKELLSKGRNLLLLVPEVLLATHLIERYRRRLGKRVLPFHGYMKAKERGGVLLKTEEGGYVVIGPKSLIISPIKNVGLIIVDEEHDFSYKNEGEFSYHARDVAVMRGKIFGIPVLLGTATPSADTWLKTKNGEAVLLRLTKKFMGGKPETFLFSLKGKRSFILPQVMEAISSTVQKGKQVIALINRRGYASFLICKECGWIPYCERCSISLHYYKKRRVLLCHYCGYKREVPSACERCGESMIQERGWGTERVEEFLSENLPFARVMRIDSDVVKNWMEMKDKLKNFEDGNADILVGTQMIGKGLDIKGVELVVVLNIENAFLFPDFRAGERTYQLLTQVIGRAGRMEKGRAIIQAYNIYHPAIQMSVRGQIEEFLDEELEKRRSNNFPPFCHLCLIKVKSKDASRAESSAKEIRDSIEDVNVKGPTPAPIMKMRGMYIWQILLYHEERERIISALKKISSMKLKGVKIEFNLDPINFA